MHEYKLLESDSPASAKQLGELSVNEGWKLQIIVQWNNKFYYHLIRDKLAAVRTQCEYQTIQVDALVSKRQLEKLAEERWMLQSVIWWENSIYYYMVREKITNMN